jgi:hypothetical protein
MSLLRTTQDFLIVNIKHKMNNVHLFLWLNKLTIWKYLPRKLLEIDIII